MSDPFARYMMPAAIREGATVALPGTSAVFRITPPTNVNEAYYGAFSAALSEGREVGDARVSTAEVIAARKTAFKEACILSAEGLPDGMGAKAFFDAYPLALKHVFEKAVLIADEVDASIEEGLGNSSASRPGSINGEAVRTSTKTSSKQASSRKAAAARI